MPAGAVVQDTGDRARVRTIVDEVVHRAIFDPATGKRTWEYFVKEGEGALDHPSLARELPDTGDILVVDDLRDRIVVIDRQTKRIIWQYGVTDTKGHAPGYLNYPDGLDLDVFRDWKAALQGQPPSSSATTPASSPTSAPR